MSAFHGHLRVGRSQTLKVHTLGSRSLARRYCFLTLRPSTVLVLLIVFSPSYLQRLLSVILSGCCPNVLVKFFDALLCLWLGSVALSPTVDIGIAVLVKVLHRRYIINVTTPQHQHQQKKKTVSHHHAHLDREIRTPNSTDGRHSEVPSRERV